MNAIDRIEGMSHEKLFQTILVDNDPNIKPKFLLDAIIEEVVVEVKSHKPDLTTDKGRKAIISLAAKVSKVKVKIDDAGKELGTEWRDKINAINERRRSAKDALEKLRDETRGPLTQWEAEEQAKIVAEAKAVELEMFHASALQENELWDREATVREAEAKIAKAAEVQAEADAKKLAEERELQFKQDAEAAVAARIEQAEKAKQAEADRRAADVEHQRTTNRQAAEALTTQVNGYSMDIRKAQMIVSAIASGRIPNITINY